MISFTVKTGDGVETSIDGKPGDAMMEPIRDAGLIDATCGGAASCGTCHIYTSPKDYPKLGERTEDEEYMLEALEDYVEIRDTSRLCCQVKLSDDMNGLAFEIAPEA